MIIYPCTEAISKLPNCKNFKNPSLKTNKFLGDFRAKQEFCVAASLFCKTKLFIWLIDTKQNNSKSAKKVWNFNNLQKMDGTYIKTLIGILNQNRSLTAISRLGTSKLVGHSDFHNGENAKSIMILWEE